jgi:hypothetical protein
VADEATSQALGRPPSVSVQVADVTSVDPPTLPCRQNPGTVDSVVRSSPPKKPSGTT